ncbi:MAG: TonB-dependent receptor [Acidobacteria bacterium]|nr:MAG: TonB-dependent receptor [Acidobacteriota bacterium]
MRDTRNFCLRRSPAWHCCAVLLLLACCAVHLGAQTIVGRISGTVKDATGAVVPAATVTVTNTATNLTRTAMTDEDGFYTVTNLPVGTYTVVAERQGFKKAGQSDISLTADARLTVDLALEAGQVTETVQVTSSGGGETVNTTSGEVARVVDKRQVQELALNGRNYMQLVTLIPGSVILDEDQLALTTSLSISQAAINGNRPNYNNLTVDGGFNMDSGSNNSQVNNVGIDFIQEVKIQTSNFSAEYGRNSGAAINIVTRGGGNAFHGSAFEFFRNDKLDARRFFAPVRANLRFNNFGWNFNGPIKKDKFFFFGGQEWKYIRQLSDATRRTLPTRAERAGDFSARSGTLNVPTGYTAINPATGAVVPAGQPIPGRNLSNLRLNGAPAGITPDGAAIAAVYTAMEKLAASYSDATAANNSTFQQPNPFNYREDNVRLDYRFNDRHSVYGRYFHDHYDLIDPFGTFITSQLPTIPTNRLRPGTSVQLSYTWLISPKLINEAKINASWNGQRIPPVGEFWKRETFGFKYPQLFSGGRFDNGIPDTTITGFASFNGPSGSLLSPTTDIAESDNLTIVHGKHSIKTGVLVVRNRKDQNGRSNYTGTLAFSTSGNTRTTGNAFADALLGNFRTYNEADNDPIGFFRFNQVEAYATDSWKVASNLSLEFGARYYYYSPTYLQANNAANFDPSLYNPTQAVTILANGNIDPNKGGNRFNGLVRAGDGIPADQVGRVSIANSPILQAVPTGAPRGFYQPAHRVAPRVGFAYAPFGNDKTSIRGGFGIFYDKAEGNLIFSQLNVPPFINTPQFENGNIASPSGGTASALAPFGTINAIDPNLTISSSMNFSLGVQRELPHGFFVEATYVGNLGRHLIRQPDINMPTFAALAANAALPSAQRLSVNALRPYKGFSQIRMRLSDANSNYNGLQLYTAKRKGDLGLTVSYTWSKALTDTSGNADNVDVGDDPFNRHLSYGPATFDRRHIFVTTYDYRLPFLRNLKGVGGAVLSGWEISGITRYQSGPYLTVTGNTSIGARRADYLGGPVLLPSPGPDGWINPAAFAAAPDTRRGNSGVGNVIGPNLQLWDFSMRKQFSITEKVKLRLQADMFNAFNRANFKAPATVVTNGGFGTITNTGPARNIQFGLKLDF